MNARWKVNGWRQEKAPDDDPDLSPGKYLYKQPVQNNMAEKNNEIEEQTVDIIIAAAENIKDRNQFDDNISLKVVPVRIKRTEYVSKSWYSSLA